MPDIGDIFIMGRVRSIGAIVPDVVVREVQTDFLRVTDHPVEKGAAISDHAFKTPSEIEMRVGFSNSTGGSESYVDEAYEMFLALQLKREPFDVITGKRAYHNMLISAISVETDERTEHALLATIGLREVLFTQTQTTGGPAKSGDPASQAAPQTTASITDGGTKAPAIVGKSVPTFAAATQIQWNAQPAPFGAGGGVTRSGGSWSQIGAFS